MGTKFMTYQESPSIDDVWALSFSLCWIIARTGFSILHDKGSRQTGPDILSRYMVRKCVFEQQWTKPHNLPTSVTISSSGPLWLNFVTSSFKTRPLALTTAEAFCPFALIYTFGLDILPHSACAFVWEHESSYQFSSFWQMSISRFDLTLLTWA